VSTATDPDKPGKALGRKAARGAAITGISQGCKMVLAFGTTIIVARLLTPSDFGVIAMVAPIAGFLQLFQNLGLSQATVQARELSSEHSNALFWINVAAAACVALLMVAIAPLVGVFYEDIRPAHIIAATGLTVLVAGFKLQHQALLNRHMRFGSLSLNEVAAAVTTSLATITAAVVLDSYWALWFGAFMGQVMSTAMMWRASGWRPRLGVNLSGTRELINVGANVTGFDIANFFARNADNIIVAKAFGVTSAGLYERSYKLMLFPLQNINWPLARVVLPTLRRLQDLPELFAMAYLTVIRALTVAAMPGILAAAICSDDLIAVLLGPRWAEAAPIFFWLSLAGVIQPVSSATGWLFLATGRSRQMAKWGLFASSVTVLSFFAGLPWGPEGVAAAYFISQLLLLPFQFKYSTASTPVSARSLYATMLPTLVAGAITATCAHFLEGELSTIGFVAFTFVATYGLSFLAQCSTRGGREAIGRLLQLGRSALPARASRSAPVEEKP
jgi:PST family polysaccharide transporter